MRDINNNYDDFSDFLIEALEPIATVMADDEVAGIFKTKQPPIKLVAPLMGKHRESTIKILAALRGQSPEEFKASFNAFGLVNEVLALIKSPVVTEVFQSAEQTAVPTSSGSATENITE